MFYGLLLITNKLLLISYFKEKTCKILTYNINLLSN